MRCREETTGSDPSSVQCMVPQGQQVLQRQMQQQDRIAQRPLAPRPRHSPVPPPASPPTHWHVQVGKGCGVRQAGCNLRQVLQDVGLRAAGRACLFTLRAGACLAQQACKRLAQRAPRRQTAAARLNRHPSSPPRPPACQPSEQGSDKAATHRVGHPHAQHGAPVLGQQRQHAAQQRWEAGPNVPPVGPGVLAGQPDLPHLPREGASSHLLLRLRCMRT